jgi:predicted Rossmann-fold nucleotide-binding protein
VALPGGIGTLSEIALTWSLLQTGEIKRKPFVLIGRVWSETVATFIREADGYLHAGDGELLRVVDRLEEVVGHLARD